MEKCTGSVRRIVIIILKRKIQCARQASFFSLSLSSIIKNVSTVFLFSL